MDRLMAYLAAGAALVAIVLGVLLYGTASRLATTEAARDAAVQGRKQAQDALKIADRTLAAWGKDRAATGLKSAQAQEGLSQALQRDSAWSDTQLPDSVFDALQAPSRGPEK